MASDLVLLDWDTAHFRFPVAKVVASDINELDLRKVLSQARAKNIKLLYVITPSHTLLSEQLLGEFSGTLVDRKATYTQSLIPKRDIPLTLPSGYSIEKHPRVKPQAELNLLAIAAGSYSRFRVDSRIELRDFERLYLEWMSRSVLGELADAVFVVLGGKKPVAVVTVTLRGVTGRIGLVAVGEELRGKGVGTVLIHKAHVWMTNHGASEATVVTQLDNTAACRLYQRCGYTLTNVENYYHFWPLS